MVETIHATTSIIGRHHRLYEKFDHKDRSFKRRYGHQRHSKFMALTIKSLAMEVAKEANSQREGRSPHSLDCSTGDKFGSSRLWPPPNKADNPSLHNPLLRLERMGCGWLGVIFEWEGVIVDDDPGLEKQAWLVLSQEEGKSPPPAFVLRRIEGMKSEQAISEVLCWCRDPSQLRRLASRKEEIYQSLQGGFLGARRSGCHEFLSGLVSQRIPIAIASTRPRKSLEESIEGSGVKGLFEVIVAAEDVHRGKPDPEMFVYAAQLLGFIPERCIVFGNSNSAVEAAHDAGMKCVAVASKHPVYELSAADLVVRRLHELTLVDLKNLADIDSPEFGSRELEVEEATSLPSVAVDDPSW